MPIWTSKAKSTELSSMSASVGDKGYNDRGQAVYWNGSRWSTTRPADPNTGTTGPVITGTKTSESSGDKTTITYTNQGANTTTTNKEGEVVDQRSNLSIDEVGDVRSNQQIKENITRIEKLGGSATYDPGTGMYNILDAEGNKYRGENVYTFWPDLRRSAGLEPTNPNIWDEWYNQNPNQPPGSGPGGVPTPPQPPGGGDGDGGGGTDDGGTDDGGTDDGGGGGQGENPGGGFKWPVFNQTRDPQQQLDDWINNRLPTLQARNDSYAQYARDNHGPGQYLDNWMRTGGDGGGSGGGNGTGQQLTPPGGGTGTGGNTGQGGGEGSGGSGGENPNDLHGTSSDPRFWYTNLTDMSVNAPPDSATALETFNKVKELLPLPDLTGLQQDAFWDKTWELFQDNGWNIAGALASLIGGPIGSIFVKAAQAVWEKMFGEDAPEPDDITTDDKGTYVAGGGSGPVPGTGGDSFSYGTGGGYSWSNGPTPVGVVGVHEMGQYFYGGGDRFEDKLK